MKKKKNQKKNKTNDIFDLNNKVEKKEKSNEAMGAPKVNVMKEEVENEMLKHRKGI